MIRSKTQVKTSSKKETDQDQSTVTSTSSHFSALLYNITQHIRHLQRDGALRSGPESIMNGSHSEVDPTGSRQKDLTDKGKSVQRQPPLRYYSKSAYQKDAVLILFVQSSIQDGEFRSLQGTITSEDLLVAQTIIQLMDNGKSDKLLESVQQEVREFSHPTQTATAWNHLLSKFRQGPSGSEDTMDAQAFRQSSEN